eukprot:2495381-Heterocapsa_arctica.AAC.1
MVRYDQRHPSGVPTIAAHLRGSGRRAAEKDGSRAGGQGAHSSIRGRHGLGGGRPVRTSAEGGKAFRRLRGDLGT